MTNENTEFNSRIFIDTTSVATQLTLERMHAAQRACYEAMRQNMYGDDRAYIPPTRWQRFPRYWRGFSDRAHDAWDVLLGCAEIGY